MSIDEKFENIIDILENLPDNEKVYIHNRFCDYNNYMDNIIYFTEELDDLFDGKKPTEILRLCEDIDLRDDYFIDGVYGLESVKDLSDVIDFNEIANYCIDYGADFDNEEIADILAEDDDEE